MASFYFNLFKYALILVTCSNSGFCYEIQRVTCQEPLDNNTLLESPQWSVAENALYWVNNFGQMLYRMDGETGEITRRNVCFGPSTLIVPVKDHPGYVVVAVRASLYLLKWGAPGGDQALRLLTTVDLGKPDNNIDDGKADALGRLWFGTFGRMNFSSPALVPSDQGTLYSIDGYNFDIPDIKKRPVSLSNGIAWSLDNKKMYYNDSPTRRVVAFNYNLERGEISNETIIFRFDDHDIPGIPDGMTIDADGNIWVATFNTMILNIDPGTGELLQQIELPVDQASSLMWGGELLDILYVTTGRLNVTDPLPLSGALLKIVGLGTKGVPENQFKFPDAPNFKF